MSTPSDLTCTLVDSSHGQEIEGSTNYLPLESKVKRSSHTSGLDWPTIGNKARSSRLNLHNIGEGSLVRGEAGLWK